MRKRNWLMRFSALLGFVALSAPLDLSATPSTHVWAPSTDIQADGTFHLTGDMYVPAERDASGKRPNTVTNVGLEGGYWPVKNTVGLEYGFDHIAGLGDELDSHPFYFNAKAGVPENAYAQGAPALAGGIYNLGTEKSKTDFNTWYLKTAKTFSVREFSLGRFSAGWFRGNSDLLLNGRGESDDNGVLLAWERVLTEFSDKLWLCVDYQGSDSGFGALAPGVAWKFADNTSVVLGYIMPNNRDLAATWTVQLDIDFNLFQVRRPGGS